MIRVQSVPAAHRYVRGAIGDVGEVRDGVVVLPDPPVPDAAAGVWWPHPALDGAWLAEHRDQMDVVHVHFGYEYRSPAQVRHWTRVLGRPLVVTVHDLQLPHAVDQTAHLERTGILVQAADAVVTLTPGAARQIEQRWGVRAVVLPHPAMASTATIGAAVRPPKDRVTVGLHLKGLRANTGGLPLAQAVAQAVRDLPAARLVVHVHEAVRADGDPVTVAGLAALAGPQVEVVWTAPMADDAFHDYLRSIDVSVIPHRWGTHSGWLEECLDLGVVPVVPRVGYLAEQGDVPLYAWSGDAPDRPSLTAAVTRAAAAVAQGRSAAQAQEWARRRQETDAATRRAHRDLYRRVAS